MMFRSKTSTLPHAVVALMLLLPATVVAAESHPGAGSAVQESAASRLAASAGQDKGQLARRIESVGHLLETSAGARQIEASQDAQALAVREEARTLYKTARDAFDAGDLQKTSRLLAETTMLMFKAVRFAAPKGITVTKEAADFKIRQESVKALLSAYQRIASEKAAKGTNETISEVETIMNEAAKLAEAGNYTEGRAALDRAFITIKTGVRGLRQGDTLVRSLNFASKEEEYHYEIDRNDTHQMLVKMVVDEKRAASPDLDRQVSAFVVKAKELRAQAEASAAEKDFIGAIKLLEESTAELVKAIRNAGVFIPG